jgi:putative hydrolase of the HAD superfamily
VLSLFKTKELLYKKFIKDKKILDWFFDNWMKMLTPIEENIYILKSLKQKGYWLYFLSNFIKEAYIYVEGKYDFFKYFSGGILSCYVHHLKPEPEIYKALIGKYEIKPEESIFIDDHIDFLKKAKEFGFETIHYQSSTNLKNELKNFNIFL